MYKLIGNLPDKDMAMLEERIKRATKTRQVVAQVQAVAPPQPVEPERVSIAFGEECSLKFLSKGCPWKAEDWTEASKCCKRRSRQRSRG